MPRRVAVYEIPHHRRSGAIVEAMCRGIRLTGDIPIRRDIRGYEKVEETTAVFYGYIGTFPRVMREIREAGGRVVYIDLGYWGRNDGGKLAGYHKFSVNDRHPTAYFQRKARSLERFRRFGIPILPWRIGRNVVVAGMSGKAAKAEGFQPNQWEREAVSIIRSVTDRPIVYRPKPSWREATPIGGTTWSPPEQPLADLFADAHAVVTHHSNVAVDGLLSGIPACVADGVAEPMSLTDIRKIESPRYPDDREQWAANIAWCQFNVAEMADGTAWRHLREEGLV